METTTNETARDIKGFRSLASAFLAMDVLRDGRLADEIGDETVARELDGFVSVAKGGF